jgi:hypothetical protein
MIYFPKCPATSQKISRILWKPKVQYRADKHLPLVPSQLNPVRTLLSHFFNIHFNPSMLGGYFTYHPPSTAKEL